MFRSTARCCGVCGFSFNSHHRAADDEDGREIIDVSRDDGSPNYSYELRRIVLKYVSHVHSSSSGNADALREHCCIQLGDAIDSLLDAGADIDDVYHIGLTPLNVGVHCSMYGLTRRLLSAGADPNVGRSRIPPLVVACLQADERMVALLLSAGANPEETHFRYFSYATIAIDGLLWPLKIAVAENNARIVRLLLKLDVNRVEEECGWSSRCRAGADVSREYSDGGTALHAAMQFVEYYRVARELGETVRMSQRYDVDYNFRRDRVARVRVVEALLAAGADPNAMSISSADRNSNRPLDQLCNETQTARVAWLYETPYFVRLPHDVIFDNASHLFETLAKGGASLSGYHSAVTARGDWPTPYDNRPFEQLFEELLIARKESDCMRVFEMFDNAPLHLRQIVDRQGGRVCARHDVDDWAHFDFCAGHNSRSGEFLSHMFRVGVDLRMLSKFGCALMHAGLEDGASSGREFTECKPNFALVKALVVTKFGLDRLLAEHLTRCRRATTLDWVFFDDADVDRLLEWLADVCRRPPSLKHQCRTVVRRRLSEANGYASLALLVERLMQPSNELPAGVPKSIGSYLLYDDLLPEFYNSVD